MSVQKLLFCSWFASSGVCANANLIVITSKEPAGAESIVYSAGAVTRRSSFTKPGFKNQTAPEQIITSPGISLTHPVLLMFVSETDVIIWIHVRFNPAMPHRNFYGANMSWGRRLVFLLGREGEPDHLSLILLIHTNLVQKRLKLWGERKMPAMESGHNTISGSVLQRGRCITSRFINNNRAGETEKEEGGRMV